MLTETVGLFSVSMALTIITVAGVAGAHNPAEVISALLLAWSTSTHIIVLKNTTLLFVDI